MGYRLQMSAEIYEWLADLRDDDPPAAELARALDRHYQARLDSLTALRRREAEAATLRKDLERQLAEPESQHPAGLRARHGQVMETLVDLKEASRHA